VKREEEAGAGERAAQTREAGQHVGDQGGVVVGGHLWSGEAAFPPFLSETRSVMAVLGGRPVSSLRIVHAQGGFVTRWDQHAVAQRLGAERAFTRLLRTDLTPRKTLLEALTSVAITFHPLKHIPQCFRLHPHVSHGL
jgi:hypothetical protein